MPEDLPPGLADVIGRISVPERWTGALPPGLTGELAALQSWWSTVSDASTPRVAILVAAPAPINVTDALRDGIDAADRAIDAGATLVVPRCTSHVPVPALTIIGLMTRTESPALVYQSVGMTDREWMDRCAAVRDGVVQVTELRAAPLGLLDALSAVEIAFVTGALLGASARRTASLVEGTDELSAALVADRLSFRAREWWRAGAMSPDPARQAAVDRLDLSRGLPFGRTDDDGRGADATIALLTLMAAEA